MKDIRIEFKNDKQLQQLFNELQPKYQKKIVIQGLKDAAKIINNQAKINLNRVKKGKSKTNYKGFSDAFKIEPFKDKEKLGVKVGVKYYKARWLQWGTDERSYKKGVKRSIWRKATDKSGEHRTGKMQATNFFYGAVEDKKQEAINAIDNSIINAFNKVVAKYNKKM